MNYFILMYAEPIYRAILHEVCIIKGRLCNFKNIMCDIKFVQYESNREQLNSLVRLVQYLFSPRITSYSRTPM